MTLAEYQAELALLEAVLPKIARGEKVRSVTHDGRNVIYEPADKGLIESLIRRYTNEIAELEGTTTSTGRARRAGWF